MVFEDLRSYIAKLEEEEELKRVNVEVDWNLEVGAITRRIIDLRAPGAFFEKIKGYPEGYRLLGNPLGPSKPNLHARLAVAIGLSKETTTLELIDEFKKRMKKSIKPKIVESGPCKENILTGDEVDILKFPVPLIHENDGGRYIGTWHINITKDPDTGWVNWGMYRMMVQDKKSTGIYISTPMRHAIDNYRKYQKRGEPMPMAVAIGTEPVSTIIGASPVPYGINEVDMAGGVRGKAVELVKCETIDLFVPATSEIVLEGDISPTERKQEGPFGEYTGYSAGEIEHIPVFRVNCITHRNNPIFPMCNHGKPYDDGGVLGSLIYSSVMADDLEKRGVPFVNIYNPAGSQMTIVSAKPVYPRVARTIASTIWSNPHGPARPYVIVVGDDIDVTDMEDVMWCIGTRCDPSKRLYIESDVPTTSLNPFLDPHTRVKRIGSRVLIDATFPAEWPVEETPQIISFTTAWPKEIQEKVLNRWEEYFKS